MTQNKIKNLSTFYSFPRSLSPMEETDRCLVTGPRCVLNKPQNTSVYIVTGRKQLKDNSLYLILWVQFRLVMHYLSEMTEEQTLVMYSGHPMGLFPSLPSSPRAIITNGMVLAGHTACTNEDPKYRIMFGLFSQVIPNYSSREQYEKMFALGISM